MPLQFFLDAGASYADEGAGGVVFGGGAGQASIGVNSGIGGLVFGGVASEMQTGGDRGVGGVVLGGVATEHLVDVLSGTGGVVFGGKATERLRHPTRGGLVLSRRFLAITHSEGL